MIGKLSGQVKEVEDLWKKQLDTTEVELGKPVYLQISVDKALDIINRQPSFGIYKDNYFVTAIPLNMKIDKYTSDAKFQISIRQRLTKAILPFNSILMLTYTQKSFWDLYKESQPFKDNNYNPGLALMKPIISKNELYGVIILAFEHESNGKDSYR